MNKAYFWKLFYSRWKKERSLIERIPGYTLLLPVPGDLTFFLQIATQVCRQQDTTGLHETLVIPDTFNSEIYDVFLNCQKQWPEGKMRLIHLHKFDSWIVKKAKNPGHNHWLQLIRGIDEVQTSHVLLHDADLFIADPDFFRNHYQRCLQSRLSCCGVSKAWDSWFSEHGIDHIVSTWEMVFSLNWIKRFAPWQLHGQDFIVDNQPHTCDTTYYAQVQTPAKEVGLNNCDRDWVHFNYVISSYRWFQKSTGPFEDRHFRLLLIRMFHDMFPATTTCEIPSAEQLALGLTFKDARVTYHDSDTLSNYADFRTKLQQLLESDILSTQQQDSIKYAVSPFDDSLIP